MPSSPMGWHAHTPKDPSKGLVPHLMPVDDLREHEFTAACACKPEVDDDGMVIHNAFDERELIELGKRRIQ